mgnify:CR=1 FL=1
MRGRPKPEPSRQGHDPQLPGQAERERADIRIVSILGGVALLVAVGMWFYTKDRVMIAGDGTTVKQSTTGSATRDAAPAPASQ